MAKDFKKAAEYAIQVAGKHAAANQTSIEWLERAVAEHTAGDFEQSRMSALNSLRHSVGRFHNDFKAANKA